MSAQSDHRAYWRRNLKYLAVLMTVWFVVSLGCGVLFADALDQYKIPGTGFKVGFWFAQQGSIFVFVLLIFNYNKLMSKLDSEYGVSEDD